MQWFLEMDSAILSFILTAFLAGLSATLPPGPIFAMVVTESLKRGFIGGFMVFVGHAIVEVIVVVALMLGFSIFLGSDPTKAFISVLGGFILILMGYDLVKGSYRATIYMPEEAIASKRVAHNPLISGVVAAVANPYFIIWWSMVGGAFVFSGLELLGLMGAVLVLIAHWASDFPWFSFVSYCVSKGRKFLSNKVYRGIIGICGIFLVARGIMFFADGITLILHIF